MAGALEGDLAAVGVDPVDGHAVLSHADRGLGAHARAGLGACHLGLPVKVFVGIRHARDYRLTSANMTSKTYPEPQPDDEIAAYREALRGHVHDALPLGIVRPRGTPLAVSALRAEVRVIERVLGTTQPTLRGAVVAVEFLLDEAQRGLEGLLPDGVTVDSGRLECLFTARLRMRDAAARAAREYGEYADLRKREGLPVEEYWAHVVDAAARALEGRP